MTSKPPMTSSRPYLIRALYEWIVDNGLTPYLLVNSGIDGTLVPTRFVEDGKIVLNVSPSAVRSLDLGNKRISFGARFGGKSMDIEVPIAAVLAIYARENGQGMAFQDQTNGTPPNPPEPPQPVRPRLKIVK